MTDRTSFGGRSGGPRDGARNTSGRLSSDTDRPAEAAYGVPGAVPSGRRSDVGQQAGPGVPGAASAPDSVDPELVTDLGDEFELRGDQLEAELEAARAEAAQWRDAAARAQADFENTKKRLEARQADAVLRAGERVVEAILPVIDDLERAIDHAVGAGEEVAEGLSAVHRKLVEVIGREGCTVIDPLGQAFDHDKHNAVQMREDPEVPDHTVVEVFQKGYEMHGRVLRPAMVIVSTGGPERRD